MGFRASPFYAVFFYYMAEEFIRGNHLDQKNALRWDEIVLNLPGERDFNPALPWCMKWDSKVGNIVADIITYVDDLRTFGVNE